MNEGNVYNMTMKKNFMVMLGVERYIKEHCHLLCFSQNYQIGGVEYEGSNHPAMWAYYAENSNGICIVIDKEAFIKSKKTLDAHFNKFEDVVYRTINTPCDEKIEYEVKTPEEFIQNNWRSLFLTKHNDWNNEDEHRLFIMNYNGKLRIDGCIKYIVLGRKVFMDDPRIKTIMDIVVEPHSGCFRKFAPHYFVTMCYSNRGYSTIDIAFKITEIIKRNIVTSDFIKGFLSHQSRMYD